MEKVCLITPPSGFLLDDRVFPSLGILKVAAALEENEQYIVQHIDLSGISDFTKELKHLVVHSGVKKFGITATTPQIPAAIQVARTIRITVPDARIVLGGPHVTMITASNRKPTGGTKRAANAVATLLNEFDCIVAGDGEKASLEAFSATSNVVIDADNDKSPLFLKKDDLNRQLLPSRHLIDLYSYKYTIDGEPATSMIAQLGCPFACGFCGGRMSPTFRRVRIRSTNAVLDEMHYLHDHYGFRALMLYDDELNVNKNMFELMYGIRNLGIELGFQWKLRGFIKAELFDDRQAEAMAEAGFRWILVGFESGSERILDNINKKATKEDNTNCLRIARKHGIKVKALMSLGHPGESAETVKETVEWLLEERPDDFDMTVITTYPGTPYYDESIQVSSSMWMYSTRNGDRLHSKDVDFTRIADYYKGIPGNYKSHVWTDYLSSDAIVLLRDEAETVVRKALGLLPNTIPTRYDASMGQLPGSMLKLQR